MKKIYLQRVKCFWLTLIGVGLANSHLAWAQAIPDVQWTKPGTALTVTNDGTVISTRHYTQNTISLPKSGDGIVKYSLQGDQIWATPFLDGGDYIGGQLQGYNYEAIDGIRSVAPITNGGVAVAGKTSFIGSGVATTIMANGTYRPWVNSDRFPQRSIVEDIIGTPDGGYLLIYTDTQYLAEGSTSISINLFAKKYNASGAHTWTKKIDYSTANSDLSLTKGEAVTNTPDGGYLITGYYNTTGKVNDQDNSSLTENTGWVAKLDGQGNVIWQKLLDALPLTANATGSIIRMYSVTDVILSVDGTGYTLIGAGLVPGSTPTTSILELDWTGNFKRAKSLGTSPTPAFITRYTGSYYAVGTTSLTTGADPQILKISSANVGLTDPALFNIVAQRIFDSPANVYLQDINRAGDGSLVFLGSTVDYGIVKLAVEPPTPGLTLSAPTYNCQSGFITFNTSGGDGSTITYIAPGVSRASATDNVGTVEAGLRNDPKTITITATQNGTSVTYVFDLKAACNNTPPALKPPVLNQPIPELVLTVGQSLPPGGFPLGSYFSDPNLGGPANLASDWVFSVTGLPNGLYVFTQDLSYTPAVTILGAPTAVGPGIYNVTVTATIAALRGSPLVTTFKITVLPNNPPPTGAFALVIPDYNCQTGAITFKTTGGNGGLIEYQAAGITGWTTNPNQFVDQDSRTATDVQPFTLMARQSGNVVTYTWDLKAACSNAPLAPKPPMVRPIPDQTYTLGQSVYFPLGSYFSDPTTGVPNYRPNWSFSATGLPPGVTLFLETVELMFTPAALLVGTASAAGIYTVTVSARTVGGTVRTSFKITVSHTTPPPTGTFALIAPDYNCNSGAITFKTSGSDGSLIEYQAAGISGWTTNPNQFVDQDSRTANDVKPFTLMARQAGQVVTYIWDLKAACGRARAGVDAPGLQVRVLSNPVVGQRAEVEISGVPGQSVRLTLVDGQGRGLYQHVIDQATGLDQVSIPLGQRSGLLLLQVNTASEQKTLKLLKE